MSEVKRFDHVNHAHVDDCEHSENPEGLWVKASDYDALAAEAQALREERDSQQRVAINAMEELASLRARVVVAPQRKLLNAGVPGLNRNSGWNACLDELARLNGKTVSEGLLRRLARPADRYDEVFTLDRHEAAEELRVLLSEQEGGKQ
ncbi:hypothetical protein IPC1031_24510 [Pseudomonas aeruginosa]|uniref:hypothetical protein n=1 Tax=Pseudomonas aeruginosa TaxID=287 RepID=UPI000FEFF0EF|nr:hypothetical protein [Pseudomonas aeruginosa]RPS02987.1 hypothetical protein IPC1031_24510 [Pseudomonas aeruginosa]